MPRPAPSALPDRRQCLLAGASAAAGLLAKPARADTSARRSATLAYLARHARPDGGFALGGHDDSHLTPTFAVIGCHRLLGEPVPARARVAAFVRTHHPAALKKLEQEHRVFTSQQVRSLLWLGEDASPLAAEVKSWQRPLDYLRQYERHGYPVFQSETAAFTCRRLLGLSLDDLNAHFVPYLLARRRPNGTFNNTPAADGSDGHVLNTWWGLQALAALGRLKPPQPETVDWLRRCQLAGGGFTYRPAPDIGGTDDVAYTWAAVRALAALGEGPARRDACLASLASLANPDGGFADRPGWASNPVATYYALDALASLGELDRLPPVPAPRPPREPALPEGLRVFSIQIEAHGTGSPAEAVHLAQALRIHLWGAKNAHPGWVARAQALADRARAPVRFFTSNEEYGTWLDVPGLGTYSHASDVIAPAAADIGPSLAGPAAVSWPEFRRRRLAPLEAAAGRLVWQFGENEELVRILLDDSLARGGFTAISTFHFGNPDFTNSEPFLMRYRGQIPFIALQDAHGDEPWWFADMTTGFRTLFLAREPTWEGWLTALKNNWVAAVRRDAVTAGRTRLHAGSPAVLAFVRAREPDWRWWDNPASARPMLSLVALTPADADEAGRPGKGVALRVRCAWENSTQGYPRQPLAELTRLEIDGRPVIPSLVTRPHPRGAGYADHYYLVTLPAPAPGPHTARAVARVLATGAEVSRAIEFHP